ncbi:MAG TPA: hypothetical protein PKD51_10995 [Saprospiraceae bacterium]|nr:hypothetical protein [Saprospiraceae bacterium]
MSLRAIFCLTYFFFAISCQQKQVQDYDLYMGAYRILDQTIPYPFFIEKKNNTVSYYNYLGEKIDSITNIKDFSIDDTINLTQFPFKILYIEDQKLNIFPLKDSIQFPITETGQIYWKNRATFIKITEDSKLGKGNIQNIIQGNSFQSQTISHNPNDDLKVTKDITFSSDSLTTMMTYFYEGEPVWQETQTQKYHLFDLNGNIFISTTEDISNPQHFLHIADANKNSITIKYFINDKEQIETYQKSKKTEPQNAIGYKNCFDGHQGEYYYQSIADTEVTYRKGNEYLIKKIAANAPIDQGDGYIIVHFNVNCHGKVGVPGLQQMDKKFKSKKFSAPLIKHMLAEISKLDDWPSTETSYDFITYKDVHAFLMFKIENGKITDLCP